MPELPEVETIVRRFRPRLLRKRIAGFEASWPRQISPSVARVRRAVCGRRILELARRGKLIVIHLDDGSALLLHLKMSGRLAWVDRSGVRLPEPHERARLIMQGGERLLFCDARKFGRIRHVRDVEAALDALGPEPLSAGFDAARLLRMLGERRRRIKPLLLDQAFVAGLGNIYTDEALFRAGLHPLRRACDLDPNEVRRLRRAIRSVLRDGIRRCGTSIDWIYPGGRMQDYLRVYGRAGEPCPRCGTPIQRIMAGQRSTHLCPRCQPP
ncbi:MAG: DNA-formamidopyrimidine glycosylase [Deltaproteobacteria bacterium]|nr:DNA-formamidopyrimidine glycosylase [Deltaproteobacteria bacterium]